MKVFLIGCGCGRASYTAEAENALSDAELIIGPERLLNELPDELKGIRKEAALPLDIAKAIHLFEGERVCVMLRGSFRQLEVCSPCWKERNFGFFPAYPAYRSLQRD